MRWRAIAARTSDRPRVVVLRLRGEPSRRDPRAADMAGGTETAQERCQADPDTAGVGDARYGRFLMGHGRPWARACSRNRCIHARNPVTSWVPIQA